MDRAVVVVGNGSGAVGAVLKALPESPGVAVVVTCSDGVHLMRELDGAAMRVVELAERAELARDTIYVVPSTHEARIDGQRALQVVGPSDETASDRLLRSLADQFGRECAAVLLDGRIADCVIGLKRIKENGGLTICEEVASSAPGAAIGAGVVDIVVARDEIARRIVTFGRSADDGIATDAPDGPRVEPFAETLHDITALVRIRTGHDFSSYKRATLYRRIARRMQVCQAQTMGDYHRFLREHPSELANLLRDLLISVTNFFRDADAFESLAQTVIPRLFANKHQGDQVRVWSAACATGEEAYSLAMLLVEYATHLIDPPAIQVFATDIDEDALAEARAGIYPSAITADVSRARLDRFFKRENDHYRVTKELRDLVLFSPHNLLRDPPFSRLDLASCRNLLIYLNRDAQDRVLNLFHFGLRADGYLFLGSSESADNMALQFQAVDPAHRTYIRRMVPTTIGLDTVMRRPVSIEPAPTPTPAPAPATVGQLHYRLVEQYAPPSVLVNEDLDIVHLSEHAGDFLTLSGGEPTRQLLRLAHPALRLELRGAIYAARQSPTHSDHRVVRFDGEHGPRAVGLRVRAVEIPELGSGLLLVIFDEATLTAAPTPPADSSIEPVVRQMEDELRVTREQLRGTVEQYEASLEELKASNEELHAINEELRSATEELETSKEELQSVNEELTTLNHELKVKIDEVTRANSDVQNLMTSTDIAVLFLDRNLHIKRFTPRAQDLFNVIPADVGRPFAHLTHKLDVDDLHDSAASVLKDLRVVERQVRTRDGRRFLARVLPYRSLDDRIDGAVLTFVNVTHEQEALEARLRSETALRTAEDRLRLALRSAPLAVIVLDEDVHPTWAYVHGRELDPPSRVAIDIFATGHADRFTAIAREVNASRSGQRIELDLVVGDQLRTYDFRVEPASGGGVHTIGFDITPSKLAEIALREADRRKDDFLATVSHELRNPMAPLRVAFDVARLSANNGPELGSALGIMDRQLQILQRLIDDLLDLSRITEGKLQLRPEDLELARVVELALETTRPLIDTARQTLHVSLPDGPLLVRGDLVRLAQVLTNLLVNASRYTPDSGSIWLEVAPDASRGRVAVIVRDNGSGILGEMLPRIFEIYFQSREELGKSQRGLGIGLDLVKRIIDLHHGTVTARSDGQGRGSEFVVELPLLRSSP